MVCNPTNRDECFYHAPATVDADYNGCGLMTPVGMHILPCGQGLKGQMYIHSCPQNSKDHE